MIVGVQPILRFSVANYDALDNGNIYLTQLKNVMENTVR